MPVDPRPEGPRALRSSLDRVVGSLGGPSASTLQAVFASWAEVAGDHLAGHTRPVTVRGGRLLVVVDDPAWATEVRYAEPVLLTRLAEVAGATDIVAVDVRVDSAGRGPTSG